MKKHILLVQKDENKIKKLEDILVPNYKVDIVESAANIIGFLEGQGVDLILMDLNEANVDWGKVISIINEKDEFKYLPIIFLTDSPDINVGFDMSIQRNIDVILNPFTPEVLLTKIGVQVELSDYKFKMDRVLEEKTKTIENLQDVMFMTIAELVECRDENTGGHVKRTAKYVEVLIKALLEREIYKDVLVSSYVKDMIRSAPLHDLGKIGISDKTLLKNGSLDEEEYEFMKTHSALGGKTIQKMINQTAGGSFLDVAKDMANYHHEKWDGSGYPEGLKGEEIPVCARVMAIADVYDALITKRPYKEAFSHDVAVEIILNGRGVSFDPIILDVFKEIHLDFKYISEVR